MRRENEEAQAGEAAQASRAYRWLLVASLGVMANVGYGAIFYSFSVLLGEGAAAGDFSRASLSTAFGLGVVVSAALAFLVGTVCDIEGSRWVFVVGAVLGCAGLAAFSQATAAWHLFMVWAFLLGPAMACAFYEPAYVAIDQWFEGSQGRHLGVLTVVAGLSVTIFVPATQWLVDGIGWRGATLSPPVPDRSSNGLIGRDAAAQQKEATKRDRPGEDAADHPRCGTGSHQHQSQADQTCQQDFGDEDRRPDEKTPSTRYPRLFQAVSRTG